MSLAEMRAKLMAQENRTQNNQERSQVGDRASFNFWNMQEGQTATVRFLPDGDPNNSFFWVERNMFKLPFTGVKGQGDRETVIQVPCLEMYGESCPILSEVRTWYKDDSLKETANRYWKKRTYLFQGFVRQNPLPDDVSPENPIRRIIISPQIFQIIKSSLMNPEIENLPTDYVMGLDFKINKTNKGGFGDYSTSNWSRKESALSDDERLAIETHGLYNLRDYLPRRPSDSEQRVIREMFEASVDGRPYDPDKWAAYYRPWGLKYDGATGSQDGDGEGSAPKIQVPVSRPSTPAVAATAKVETEVTTPPWEEEQPPVQPKAQASQESKPTSDKANDILALIRARQKTA